MEFQKSSRTMSNRSRVSISRAGVSESDPSRSSSNESTFEYNHEKELDKIKSNQCRRLVLFDKDCIGDKVNRGYVACIDINEVTDREWQKGLYVRPDNKIESLLVQGIRFGSNSLPKFEAFGRILQKMEKLYNLSIKGCPIGAGGLKLIAEIFNESCLKNLNLINCNIETIEALSLHPLLNLSHLDLSKNPFGSEADCRTIGEMLVRRKTVLQEFNFSDCQIDYISAEIISNLFKNKPYKNKLASIDLGGNPIGSRGCTTFSKLIFDDSSVQSITSSIHKLIIVATDCEDEELTNTIEMGTAINQYCDQNTKKAAFVKKLVVTERKQYETTKTNNGLFLRREDLEIENLIEKNELLEERNKTLVSDIAKTENENEKTRTHNDILLRGKDLVIENLVEKNKLLEERNKNLVSDIAKTENENEKTKTHKGLLLRRKDLEIENLVKKNKLLEDRNRDLVGDIARKESENALLQSQFDELEKGKTIDLTTDDTGQGGRTDANPPPPKRLRSSDVRPSGLAFLHEQTQAVVKIKVEASERAAAAERKAQSAQQEKEAAELKLECPTCFGVDKDSCALVPCGHTFCSDCCNSYKWTNCPNCNREVASCLRLFR